MFRRLAKVHPESKWQCPKKRRGGIPFCGVVLLLGTTTYMDPHFRKLATTQPEARCCEPWSSQPETLDPWAGGRTSCDLGFGVWGLGFLGSRVWGLGFGFLGSRLAYRHQSRFVIYLPRRPKPQPQARPVSPRRLSRT